MKALVMVVGVLIAGVVGISTASAAGPALVGHDALQRAAAELTTDQIHQARHYRRHYRHHRRWKYARYHRHHRRHWYGPHYAYYPYYYPHVPHVRLYIGPRYRGWRHW